jgi:phosphatidylglycerol lysyltransferase
MREGRQEWRFVAGSFNRQYLQIGPLFVARDRSGQAMAFANQIPSYIAGLATIDLMRYRQDAPGGIMDFMFTSMMLQLDAMGYTKFNLGLAPFSGLDGEVSQPEEKFLNLIYRSNQKIISLRGLRQFKSKFEPVWEPKYVAYKGGTARLPSTAYALFAIMHVSKDTINE